MGRVVDLDAHRHASPTDHGRREALLARGCEVEYVEDHGWVVAFGPFGDLVSLLDAFFERFEPIIPPPTRAV